MGRKSNNQPTVGVMKSRKTTFSLRKRAHSFRYAFRGIVGFISLEHNAWIHVAMAAVAVTLGAILRISMQEWATVVILIALVLAAEAFNSAIEALADYATDTIHPLIGKAKDYAAGGVLLLAVGALIVGCIIFIPKISMLLF
jgi:diacylglycerol kinase (ATP)